MHDSFQHANNPLHRKSMTPKNLQVNGSWLKPEKCGGLMALNGGIHHKYNMPGDLAFNTITTMMLFSIPERNSRGPT